MFDFRFIYSEGKDYTVENVNKIGLHTTGGYTEIASDHILTAPLSLTTMSLFTSTGNVTVSGKDLVAIEVTEQKS